MTTEVDDTSPTTEVNDVGSYLAQLPPDRRDAIARVRDVINANVSPGYEEKLMWGMITWCVPESVMPAKDVYNKQPLCFAGLASQKSHMAVYLMSVYGSEKERAWFESAVKQAGKKLDMGKSCVRFKTLDALPLDVIGEAVSHISVEKFVESYRAARAETKTEQAKTATKGGAKSNGAAKPADSPRVAALKAGASRQAAKTVASKGGVKAVESKGAVKPAKGAAKPNSGSATKPAKQQASQSTAKKR